MTTPAAIDGLVPEALAPKRHRIFLIDYDLPVDIGFHAFEVGNPQRLLVSVDVWIDAAAFAAQDTAAAAWNYDFLRSEIRRMAQGRRFNLQETLVREIYELIAARAGGHGAARLDPQARRLSRLRRRRRGTVLVLSGQIRG